VDRDQRQNSAAKKQSPLHCFLLLGKSSGAPRGCCSYEHRQADKGTPIEPFL
jgi:hypothetical protein